MTRIFVADDAEILSPISRNSLRKSFLWGKKRRGLTIGWAMHLGARPQKHIYFVQFA
jgi:hypothetical protein